MLKESLEKFDSKSIKNIFLGYSTSSRKYRVWNIKNQTVEKNMHVVFYELNVFYDKRKEYNDKENEQKHTFDNNQNGEETQTPSSQDPPKSWKIIKYHPQMQVIGIISDRVRTRQSLKEDPNNMTTISQLNQNQ